MSFALIGQNFGVSIYINLIRTECREYRSYASFGRFCNAVFNKNFRFERSFFNALHIKSPLCWHGNFSLTVSIGNKHNPLTFARYFVGNEHQNFRFYTAHFTLVFNQTRANRHRKVFGIFKKFGFYAVFRYVKSALSVWKSGKVISLFLPVFRYNFTADML